MHAAVRVHGGHKTAAHKPVQIDCAQLMQDQQGVVKGLPGQPARCPLGKPSASQAFFNADVSMGNDRSRIPYL